MEKKNINNIQLLRGVAVLSVLLSHVMVVEKKYLKAGYLLPDGLLFGISGVDLFFVISGFVMVMVTQKRFQQFPEIGRFLYNRTTRIYPLYWLFSILVLCVYLIRPDMVNPSQGNQVNIIESFLLLPQEIAPLLMVGWTLVHEMYFYLIFSLFLLSPERTLIKNLSLWGFMVIAGNLAAKGIPGASSSAAFTIITNPLTLEFIAGCVVAKTLQSGYQRYGKSMLTVGTFMLVLPMWLYWSFPAQELPEGWLRVFLFGLPYTLIVYGAVAMELAKGVRFPGLVRLLGDASYSIYLSHTLIIEAVGWSWSRLLPTGGTTTLVLLPTMMVVVSLMGGVLISRLVEQPMLRATRRIVQFSSEAVDRQSSTEPNNASYHNGR